MITAIPPRLAPMLASSARPFDDDNCVFELKWDGVRAIGAVTEGGVRIWGRDMQSYTGRYPEIEEALDSSRCPASRFAEPIEASRQEAGKG